MWKAGSKFVGCIKYGKNIFFKEGNTLYKVSKAEKVKGVIA